MVNRWCWQGCWRESGHHDCAIVEVWRLANHLQEAVNALEDAMLYNDDLVDKLRPIVIECDAVLRKLEGNMEDEDAG